MSEGTEAAVLTWLLGDDTGSSSKCIAAHLTGRPHDDSHPSDPDDLGRCLRLLALIPALRADLPKMAAISPYWSALVARWSELEQSFVSELGGIGRRRGGSAPKTYRLMRSILDPIEDADDSVVQLGAGVTIRP